MIKYFWMILTFTAVGWYIFVTAYVAFKGVTDIREMLAKLGERNSQNDDLIDNDDFGQ